ncbi:MAG: efflux RND transporter periplasmic adaptor subunit [Terrimicrobiaceae bacterium]|nr:efflux RND transporter periplasmic adaptor subunit [Terrimicrobiaceae bacterium]
MKRLGIILVIVLAAAGVGLWQGWIPLPKGADPATESPSTKAVRDDVESKLLLSGEITPAFQVDVKAEVGGRVKVIHVEPGQRVQKGELLVTIDDTDLLNEKASVETEIEGARISLEKNRGNYERARALFEQKLISKEVFANLEADFKIAENNLEKSERRLQSVKDRLAKTRIMSPGDGIILDVAVNEGQVVVAAASVNSGTTLMQFADVSRLLIDTHVNQMDVGSLEVGKILLVHLSGNEEEKLEARIEFIAPVATVKNNIKGFQVQATVDQSDPRLKPGMSVSMEVPVGRAQDVVTVPVTAVFREQDGKVVYVRKGGQIEKRRVAVGVTNLSRAEIKSGVDEGEEILLFVPPAEMLSVKS